MHQLRVISQYDAIGDLRARYPSWTMHVEISGPGERIEVPDRQIWLNPPRGLSYAVAHVVAHLDLGHVCHHGGGTFSALQEQDAHDLAMIRLDEEGTRECA